MACRRRVFVFLPIAALLGLPTSAAFRAAPVSPVQAVRLVHFEAATQPWEVSCSLGEVPADLNQGVCEANPYVFESAIRELLRKPNSAEEVLARTVLQMLWRDPRSIGSGLPYSELQQPRFRSVVVRYLAALVRADKSSVSLQELQQYSYEFAQTAYPDNATAAAILIGATGDVRSMSLLRRSILAGPGSKREFAILSFAGLCGPEVAAEVLLIKRSRSWTSSEMKLWRHVDLTLASKSYQERCDQELASRGTEPQVRVPPS